VTNEKQALARLGRVLSVDPRSGRVAWAYFKDSRLLDYRIRNFRERALSRRVDGFILPYLIGLLDRFAPHALIMPKTRGGGARTRSAHVQRVLRILAREALARGIAVHVVSSDTVKNSLTGPTGAPIGNVQDTAAAVLQRFPELTLIMPRPREKIWQPESYSMPLFQAVAMYLAWREGRTDFGRRT